MAKMTYSEQLRHPNWQRKRLEAMQAAGFECQGCGDQETTLNVHHKRYIKGRMAWEYEIEDLVVFCEPCHEAEHAERDLLNHIISEAGPGGIQNIVGLVAGYFGPRYTIPPDLAESAQQGRELDFDLGLATCVLESQGPGAAREIVRKFVAEKPGNTFLERMVERWDGEALG